jgi:hypothetical protein
VWLAAQDGLDDGGGSRQGVVCAHSHASSRRIVPPLRGAPARFLPDCATRGPPVGQGWPPRPSVETRELPLKRDTSAAPRVAHLPQGAPSRSSWLPCRIKGFLVFAGVVHDLPSSLAIAARRQGMERVDPCGRGCRQSPGPRMRQSAVPGGLSTSPEATPPRFMGQGVSGGGTGPRRPATFPAGVPAVGHLQTSSEREVLIRSPSREAAIEFSVGHSATPEMANASARGCTSPRRVRDEDANCVFRDDRVGGIRVGG